MTKRVKCQSPDQELAKNADTVIPIPSITGSQASFEKACRLFHETRFKVNCFAAAELVWDRILTESQRRSLGSTLVAALRDHHNTVGMWRHLYQVSYQRAVIDLGEKVEAFPGMPEKLTHKCALVFRTGEINADTGELIDVAQERALKEMSNG